MNFVELQKTTADAIKNFPTFQPQADKTVFLDFGNVTDAVQAALDIQSTPPGPGYAIMVWPPAKGTSDAEMTDVNGVDSLIVVRFEVNPNFIAQQGDPQAWLNQRIADIVSAVLKIPIEPNGTKFRLAPDCLDIANFDQNLVAYYIRFLRFAVFG